MGQVIREEQERYMQELKAWLEETRDTELEEMRDFFRERLEGYEEHMAVWSAAYARLPGFLPEGARTLLDLGCGTGLELDGILRKRPGISVTGVDLSEDMLGKLRRKHPEVKTVCGDYFQEELGEGIYDAAVSFESLHHFRPEKKRSLYEKIVRALKPGGVFLEVDYIACCEEEEELLMEACAQKRRRAHIPEDVFVHFDTPLTAEHEMALLREAGFAQVEFLCCIDGASFLRAETDGTLWRDR